VVLCTGSGTESSEVSPLVRLRADLGLTDTVVVPDDVDPRLKADLLAATTVFAHPALTESLGLAMMEAMAVGKPVVAAASAGARFLIEDGINGVLVSPGDSHALGLAISDLLGDPPRRERLGTAARYRAAAFSNERMVLEVMRAWDLVLARRRSRGVGAIRRRRRAVPTAR
jgi:glycosyltransferase involved in cell wall biosynthesis